MGSYGWVSGKEPACQCKRCRFDPRVRKIPWRREWPPTPIFLLGKSHGQRSLAWYSPWGRKGVGHDLVTKQQHINEKILLICMLRYNMYVLKYAKRQNSKVLHNSDTFCYIILKIELVFSYVPYIYSTVLYFCFPNPTNYKHYLSVNLQTQNSYLS